MDSIFEINPDLQAGEWPLPISRSNWKKLWLRKEKKLILFDLDGTLLDTAGDLGAAANLLRKKNNLSPLPIEKYRPHVSRGARGMIKAALGISWKDSEFKKLKNEFLENYQKNLLVFTRFMPKIQNLLSSIEKSEITWGIVTNKHHKYAAPIIKGMNLDKRSSILVCGDTLEFSKPHPAPVSYAIKSLGFDCKETIYVGDDPRDIQSGFNAGSWTLAISFEKNIERTDLAKWGSDEIAKNSEEMAEIFGINLD